MRSIPATASSPRIPNSHGPAPPAGIIFVGPAPDTMRVLGNKVAARNLARAAGVPVMPATPPCRLSWTRARRLPPASAIR